MDKVICRGHFVLKNRMHCKNIISTALPHDLTLCVHCRVKPVVPPKPVLDPQTKTLLNLRLKQVDPANMLMQQSDGNFWTGSLGDMQAADGHEVRNQNRKGLVLAQK